MRRWKNRALAALLAAYCSTQAADVIPPEVRRVGARLACLCKTCRNTVGDCTMLECHYSKPARAKIMTMAKEGAGDEAIVASFVKEQGVQALSVPPAEGFNAMLGLMPWLAGLLGLLGIAWFINRNRKATAPELGEIGNAALAKYRESIERDMANLD